MVLGRGKVKALGKAAPPAGALQSGLGYLHACRYKEAARDLRRAVD